jgi:uncharacterized repeat protein (TIGR01451 family)
MVHSRLIRRFNRPWLACMFCVWAFVSPVQAQIALRYLDNPSFELPDFSAQCTSGGAPSVAGGPPTRGYLAASNVLTLGTIDIAKIVPSWLTTATDTFNNTFMCNGVATAVYRNIQVFRGDESGPSQDGLQHIELNPEIPGRVYQRVCVAPNETFSYRWYHRRRSQANEQARAVLCVPGAGFNQDIECGNVADQISVAPVHFATATTNWDLVTGTFVTNRSNILQAEFGFESVIPLGSSGNLLDNPQIYMRPLVDLAVPSTTTLAEPGLGNTLTLIVNGRLLSNATVVLRRSGSAIYSVDYTVGSISRGAASINASNGDITISLPAGNYNPNNDTGPDAGRLSMQLLIVNDQVVEPTETLSYTISNTDISGGNGTVDGVAIASLAHIVSGASAGCTAPNSVANYNLFDDDKPVLTKAFSPNITLQNSPVTLSFTLSNPQETITATGRVTSSVASWTDNLPSGLRTVGGMPVFSAGCLGTPNAINAGTTSISITGVQVAAGLPNGNGAATVTCTISLPVVSAPGFNNPSCTNNPAAFTNGPGNLSGVNSILNAVLPDCLTINPATNLSVTKTNGVSSVQAGQTTSYTVTFTNNGPAAADGSVVKDVASAGLSNCSVVACNATGGASCVPNGLSSFLTNTGIALVNLPANTSLDVVVQCDVKASGI